MSGPWFAEPGAAVSLLVLMAAYVGGTRRVRRSGVRVGWSTPAMFLLGWLGLVGALVSPLHPAGEALVSAHMAQHTLLVLAPLALVAGRTGTRTLQALAPTWRSQLLRRLGSVPRYPLPWWGALVLMTGTVLLWHTPPVFEAATRSGLLHATEHLSLVVVSYVYWAGIVGAGRRVRATGGALASLLVLFVTGGAAGALLTFSAVPWYPGYVERTARSGVDWLADQQLAGVAMSVPMGVVLMGVAAWLGWRWSADHSVGESTAGAAVE